MKYLKKAFIDINGYPMWILEQVKKDIEDSRDQQVQEQMESLNVENNRLETKIMLPYQGEQGDRLIKSVTKMLTRMNSDHSTKVIYTGRKLGTNFVIKDRTPIEHEHNLVYKVTCPEPTCNATYVGEVSRRFSERVKDHSGRDHKSHVATHAMETGHKNVTIEDFDIVAKDKRLANYYMRTTAEALMIKRKKPSLNAQEKSVPLKLFN